MFWYLGMILCCMLDMFATEYAIRTFGLEIELNPVIYYIVDKWGLEAMYWFRGLTVIFGGTILLWVEHYKDKASGRRMLKLGFCLSFAVVLWHAYNFLDLWLT